MKKQYTLKVLLIAIFAIFCTSNIGAQENVRILKLDPSTNSVTLKNFGDANATISGYWFCNFPAYAQVSSMTGVANLGPGEEVNIGSSINFGVADGEFGLYTSSNFGASSDMIDYLQWGNSGHQRESIAVGAGVWDAGTFVSVAPPFEYTGDGTQYGVAFWSTLGIDDFEQGSNLRLYPNPSNATLNIEFKSVITDGTLEVFNLLGKQVFVQSIASNNLSQIDVTNWDSGLYLVKISSEYGDQTKRFIKQ
ncbi:T9SS type A sorting domain-containing protein [Winogradskyella pulchriflava]|uniref:T9SS type A sorting domain-containing protein n=1 Tax=Winogradskyella pulchriflava TaxID=1110688 RepID=A0ABV6Q6F5_9FLAO